MTTAESILSRCIREDDCLLWQGALYVDGYGQKWHNGRGRRVHVALYEITHGARKPGEALWNLCGNRHCCNLDHWRLAARGSDTGRRVQSKAQPRLIHSRRVTGERHPQAKLTNADVRYIRASELSTGDLARAFGMSYRQIERIRNLKAWRSALPIVG